jgi:hypothetical protein
LPQESDKNELRLTRGRDREKEVTAESYSLIKLDPPVRQRPPSVEIVVRPLERRVPDMRGDVQDDRRDRLGGNVANKLFIFCH